MRARLFLALLLMGAALVVGHVSTAPAAAPAKACGAVTGSDPYRLDSDHDGLACEP